MIGGREVGREIGQVRFCGRGFFAGGGNHGEYLIEG